jgi:hypothetical protein
MQQMARNATGETRGFLEQRRYALHDRDTKFCSVFRATLAGRWYKTDSTPGAGSKPECVCREMGVIGEGGMLIETNLFGEASLRRALTRRAKKLMRRRRKTAIGHPIVLCISRDVRRRFGPSIYPGKEGRYFCLGDFSRNENGR